MDATDDTKLAHRIFQNIQAVRQRMDQAAAKSGRSGGDVRLIAVTKYAEAGDGMIESLLRAGCCEFGESRPQQLLKKAEHYKAEHCPEFPVQWHFIGSLQRNKVRKILPIVSMIHSLDSLRLADVIHRISDEEHQNPMPCLLEVSISQDRNKHGIKPDNVLETLDKMGAYRNIAVRGLFGMAGLESNESQIHREFALLRQTAEAAKERELPPNVSLTELSMGMSGDFEIAIEEGATLVRIGSMLYQ